MNSYFIVSGILIATRIANLVLDFVSDDDEKKQRKIKEEVENIRTKFENSSDSEKTKILKEHSEYIRDVVSARIDENYKEGKEIDDALRSINKTLREYKNSNPIRWNSLNTLKRQIDEAKYKNIGYTYYLKNYLHLLDGKNNLDCLFEFSIPKQYPYYGKIVWLSRERVLQEETVSEIICNNSIEIKYFVIDKEKITNIKLDKIPVMVTSYGPEDGNVYLCSYECGSFIEFELSNYTNGFEAVVRDVKKNTLN